MATIPNSKLTVIGAGSVGTSVAYAALIRQSAREVAIYDVQTEKVEAEVLDLAHGTLFTGSSRVMGGSDIDVVGDSDVVIVTAGAKQRPGESRLALLGRNTAILESLLPQVVERAPNAIIVLVTNPVDVLTVIAKQITGLPAGRIWGSGTVLDSSRLRWLLAERMKVAQSSVHAYIIGEHGDSEFPLWSRASIGPTPLADWVDDQGHRLTPDELEVMAHEVATAAYKVIAGKGATNFAIGLSGARIAEAILRNEHAVLPVSSVLQGEHGISGVALSLPSVVTSAGISRVIDTPMSPDEERRLQDSAEVLRGSLAEAGF